MMVSRRFHSIRAQLTLWNAGVIAVVSLVYAVGVYLFVREGLYEELDRQLKEDSRDAVSVLLAEGYDALARSSMRMAPIGLTASVARIEIRHSDGRVLHAAGPANLAPVAALGAEAREGEPLVETVETSTGVSVRVRETVQRSGDETLLVRAARSEDGLRHELAELMTAIGLGLPATVLLACLGGHFLATRALGPVGMMAARAQSVTADRLSERLPIENPEDELGRLGTAFNETLARLEHSFDSLRRFTADAAHELRTPLTALRAVGEVALRDPRAARIDRRVAESMLEEAQRLTSLVDTLLLLARADSDHVEIQRRLHDLREIAQEAVDHVEPLAGEKNQLIVLVLSNGPVRAFVAPQLIRQALLNILDNAVKFSPEGAEIRVGARRTESAAILEVTDPGPGIAAEHRERIFERFYRVDQARSRETGGAGLGLSIALWAVRANQGSIEVDSDEGRGSSFRISLPAS